MNNETLIILLVAACLIVNIITLVVVITKNKNQPKLINEHIDPDQIAPSPVLSSTVQGVVFCRNCGNQFDSTMNECPHCKTPR